MPRVENGRRPAGYYIASRVTEALLAHENFKFNAR
jgi:hypothetical protein